MPELVLIGDSVVAAQRGWTASGKYRVSFRAIDKYGNQIPKAREPIYFDSIEEYLAAITERVWIERKDKQGNVG